MSTNIIRQGAGTKIAGRSAGGEFKSHDRTSALPPAPAQQTLSKLSDEQLELIHSGADHIPGLEKVLQSHLDAGEVDTDLVFIDRDDRLERTQINTYLAGDPGSELSDELDDSLYEAKCATSESRARELLISLGVDESADVSDDLINDLGDLVRTYDTSDPINMLAKHTPKQLLRASLAEKSICDPDEMKRWVNTNRDGRFVIDDLYSGGSERSYEARTAYIMHHLEQTGVDVGAFTADDHAAISSMVTEGPYDWNETMRLDAIWYGRISDANVTDHLRTLRIGGTEHGVAGNDSGKTSIVLLDPTTGSGYDAKLSVPITATVTADHPALLDSGSGEWGYGWDDSADVYKPAYSVAVNTVQDTYAPEEHVREHDGTYSPSTVATAKQQIDAELSAERARLGTLNARSARGVLTEEDSAGWNDIHDRIAYLREQRHEFEVNRAPAPAGSSAWLALNNID